MRKTSEVMGVHYISSHKVWVARDVKKNYIYRGKSMNDAESSRIAYDKSRGKETRKSTVRGVTGRKIIKRFTKAFQPSWRIYGKSPANYFDTEVYR